VGTLPRHGCGRIRRRPHVGAGSYGPGGRLLYVRIRGGTPRRRAAQPCKTRRSRVSSACAGRTGRRSPPGRLRRCRLARVGRRASRARRSGASPPRTPPPPDPRRPRGARHRPRPGRAPPPRGRRSRRGGGWGRGTSPQTMASSGCAASTGSHTGASTPQTATGRTGAVARGPLGGVPAPRGCPGPHTVARSSRGSCARDRALACEQPRTHDRALTRPGTESTRPGRRSRSTPATSSASPYGLSSAESRPLDQLCEGRTRASPPLPRA
jgi:hypothetical protein